jgi:hypothetical protein
MIVLIAIAAWIVTLALVTGLCLAARRGDLQPQSDPLASPAGDAVELFVVVHDVAANPSALAAAPEPAGQVAVLVAPAA